MAQLKNDRFLRTIWREPVDRTPIWIMRQAGRYLPEYRKTREAAGSFMKLCKTPELATEVTLQPLRRFPLDAAILFSDILTIPDAMGLGLSFSEGKGPYFNRQLNTENDIAQLQSVDIGNLQYVYDTIQLIQKDLNGTVPLIGFCGSPWTLAAYMIEGEAKSGFPKIMKMLQGSPVFLHKLLETLAKSVIDHLNGQIAAGVDAVMLFDTWGGMLDTMEYQAFSLSYLKLIITQLNRNYNNKRIPVILFTKGGSRWLTLMAESSCDVLGLDWEISLHRAREEVGHKVALQGNLNPSYLLKNPAEITQEVARLLQEFGFGTGHIFNLGHGITPQVSPENVAVLIDAVHTLSKTYHQNEMRLSNAQ